MFEINAIGFVTAASGLKELHTLAQVSSAPDPLAVQTRDRVLQVLEALVSAVLSIDSHSAWVAADRLKTQVKTDPFFTLAQLSESLRDIESRFEDHLHFIKLFIVRREEMVLFSGADQLLGQPTADRYRSAWFDCSEAAMCLCLGRPTAAVFHSMRLLEIAIRAISKRLSIEDPIKPAQKNWGLILNKIKAEIEKLNVGEDKSFLLGTYALLEAVRHPWRNATMHVDQTYTDAEARHILQSTAMLLQKMAAAFDENGVLIEPTLPLNG